MLRPLPSFPQQRTRRHVAGASPARGRIVAQATGPREYKYKDVGSAWGLELFDESSWRGYVGNWFLAAHDPKTTRELQGMRTRRWRDSDRRTLDQVNVYSMGFMGAAPRASDGLAQADYNYTGKVFNKESREEDVSLKHSMIVALGSGAFAWLSRFWLPPVAIAGPPPPEVLAAARAAEEVDPGAVAAIRSTNWHMELFLKDGDCRWSVPLVYNSTTGALLNVAYIREFATTADPTTPHVLTTNRDAVLPPRPQLPEDGGGGGDDPGGSWLPTHGSVGRRVARLWVAPGGQQLLLDECLEEPVQWGRAEGAAEGGGELMIRLPDAMYVRAPKNIAAPAQMAEAPEAAAEHDLDGSGGAANVMRFEFGGLLRGSPASGGGAAVARIVVQYDKETGSFMDICHDVFTSPSSLPSSSTPPM